MTQPRTPEQPTTQSTPPPKLEASVCAIIADLIQRPDADIRADDHLLDDLGLDSLQEMELVSRLSEEYEVDPDLDELIDIETVADVVAFIGRYVEARGDAIEVSV